jgi:hypothetical protein
MHNVVEELIDNPTLMLGQLNHEKGLEPDTQHSRIDFDVGPAQDAGIPHAPDPLVRRRRREPDLGGNLLDREPSIVLQQAQDGDIRSVKSGALAIFPLAWVELGDPM